MVRRELRLHAIIAGEFAVDDHAAGQAKRTQDVVENVHRLRPRAAYVCGVSVNLSGKPVILANRPPA